ncbi:MAG TPA: GNAT family N-acetyltransferase [Gemmatales bacterium]|nr:GNAT family N-acetyltransferase [Gemmatales bacterium]HMP58084.1 GNAT family N-acetyltransferase [Gemmatales bacterium]
MNMQIRSAVPADLETLVQGNAAIARETEGKVLDETKLRAGVQAVLADPAKGRYFVATEGDQVIGQLMITLEWSDWRCGWFWWIQSVYVAPSARGKGVYRRLHEHARDQARQAGDVIGLRLYVEDHNTAARLTYQKVGMVPAGYRVMEQMLS